MYVIEVIPLKRGIQTESLSYYSKTSYTEGTLLQIPLRNSQSPALVLNAKPVSAAKTALKTATFSLRKLSEQTQTVTLPASLIETAKKTSGIVPASIGAILFALLPPDIRSGERPYPKSKAHKGTEDPTPTVLTDDMAHRFIAYRSHIRQTFAHRGSVLFIVPTSIHAERARKSLEKGIENRVVLFSAALGKKQLRASYEAFEDQSQAKLIIATPSYAFLDRPDITTIVVESASSSHYTLRTRPYLDVREVLKLYAKETGRSILLCDNLPKTEDEVKRRDDVYATYDEHARRLELPGALLLAQHEKKPQREGTFSLCTSALTDAIDRTLARKGHVYLHAARRGLAPAVVCNDCGYIFRCPDSGAPYSLLRTYKGDQEERWFLSGTSGRRVRASDVCAQCGSWRLGQHGIGIQQVQDQISALYPKADLFVFDHTTATTHTKAKKIVDAFYESKRAILIGTTMALPYLSKSVDISAVMSYEASRAIPTWRADETVFALLLTLREITSKDVIVQTRSESDELIDLAHRGLLDQFYDGEIAIRKALSYPPFATLILLSYEGTKEEVEAIEAHLGNALREYEVQYYSAPQSNSSKTLRHGLLRIAQRQWPNAQLTEILRALPPYIRIEINPDRIV